ncbi:MAG: choice-of-anchor Q domain-containing protein [Acidimicrobiales bacterium]
MCCRAIDSGEGNTGNATVSDSTFWGNAAAGNEHLTGVDSTVINGDGGAIDNADNGGAGTVVVSASTFSGNVATHASGTVANAGTLFVAGDILKGSCSKSGGKWSDQAYNVAANATCLDAGTSDVSHGAGRLGPLASRGGPTKTMRPLASNPAVGLVPLNTTVTLNANPVTLCTTTDQRGVPSAVGKACNAGAVQSAP